MDEVGGFDFGQPVRLREQDVEMRERAVARSQADRRVHVKHMRNLRSRIKPMSARGLWRTPIRLAGERDDAGRAAAAARAPAENVSVLF